MSTAGSHVSPTSALSYIYRWDLDKTYLQTEFDSWRSLLRTAVERAEDKRSVPGAATLLRELRREITPKPGETAHQSTRICFISGSPRQMRKVLTEKLRIDGIEFDEFILKPNLRNLLTGRFRALREQVGYKLPALLTGRAGVPTHVREICFGDDAESDAFIYSLYADLLQGRVGKPVLQEVLKRVSSYDEDALRTVALFESLGTGVNTPAAGTTTPEERVPRIFINLDRRSAPRRFDRYGTRLVPIYNYFQAALVLYELSRLTLPAVIRVAVEMIEKHRYSLESLRNSLQDLIRRGRLQINTVTQIAMSFADSQLEASLLPALGTLPSTREILRTLGRALGDLGPEPAVMGTLPSLDIDYLAALEEDLPRRKR